MMQCKLSGVIEIVTGINSYSKAAIQAILVLVKNRNARLHWPDEVIT